MELVVWLASLSSAFLVGWAFGRATKRTVYVNFPEWSRMNELKPTTREVASAMEVETMLSGSISRNECE